MASTSAGKGDVYLSVSAKCGQKTLEKKLVKVNYSAMVGDICKDINIGDFDALSARVGANELDLMEVSLDTPIEVVSSFNAKYVVFSLKDQEKPKVKANCAFQKLMTSQKKLILPPKKPDTRSDWRIYNEIIDIMEKESLGFTHDMVHSMGEKVVKAVASTIFYTKSHFDKMSVCKSIHVPDLFKQFANYIDHKANHKAQPRIGERRAIHQ